MSHRGVAHQAIVIALHCTALHCIALHCTALQVFSRVAANPQQYAVSMQMVQLYQEAFQDLLVPDASPVNLHDDAELDNAVELVGALCPPVSTAQECLELYRDGDQRRVIGATMMNDKSSRSHTLFMLNVLNRNGNGEGCDLKGRLILVDLAGCEVCAVVGWDLADAVPWLCFPAKGSLGLQVGGE